MSEVVSDVVVPSASADPVSRSSDGFESIVSLNEGFLGTGYSSAVELSFIAMAMILGYVVYATTRYFLPELRVIDSVANALGLSDR